MKTKSITGMHRWLVLSIAIAVCAALSSMCASSCARAAKGKTASSEKKSPWWKGNTHTHTFWSDGWEFPETVAQWYKSHSYQFLVITDHISTSATLTSANTDRWKRLVSCAQSSMTLGRYKESVPANWIDKRTSNGFEQIRVKFHEEYAPLLNEPGRFLVMKGEEISPRPHMNALNLKEFIDLGTSKTIAQTYHNAAVKLAEQERRTKQPNLLALNHPTFVWWVTVEDLLDIDSDGPMFTEVFNGVEIVPNDGDAWHPGVERMWDIALTKRLAELGKSTIYVFALDDAHIIYSPEGSNKRSHCGRGWVMVRAKKLTPESLIAAIERGDFYASTGVRLKDVAFKNKTIRIDIDPDPGVEYTTQFIGTLKGYDSSSKPKLDENGQVPLDKYGKPIRLSRVYSNDIGRVLAEVKGTRAAYAMTGREVYVRAKVTSTKLAANPHTDGDMERAWTQPVTP